MHKPFLLPLLLAAGPLAHATPDPQTLSGGDTTVFEDGRDAFSLSSRNLDEERRSDFFVGNSFFKKNWVAAPASTTARDGLGPQFIGRSCSACHVLDGRGQPPQSPAEQPVSLLIRLSIPGEASPQLGVVPEPTYGDQFNNDAIPGVRAEGKVRIRYEERPGQFADGEPYSLRQPHYELSDLGYGPLHPQTLLSPRIAPQLIGLGLIEAIPAEVILARADPDDRDGDGISGRANYVWNAASQRTELGRFDWKANSASVAHQVAAAFNGDIGITSALFPQPACTPAQHDCAAAPNGGDPEIDAERLRKVVFYTMQLAPPAFRRWDDPAVQRGRGQFSTLGCASCHVPEYRTGTLAGFPELSQQTIRPYSDFLLHDMGPALADGRPDFAASGREWRTPPLWGIGLFPAVNRHSNYLHDGRARSLLEAVLWHGGEAEAAKQRVLALDKAARADLIAFLKAL